MKMWWVVVAGVMLGTRAFAVFPATQYTYTEPSGLIVKSDFSNLAEEVEAIVDVLNFTCGTDLACVLDTADIDTSTKLRTIVTDETGTGSLVFQNTPVLITPVVTSYVAGSLPSAGTPNRAAFVTGAADCTTSGTSVCLCRDTGSVWQALACVSGSTVLRGVSADEPYCQTIPGLLSSDGHMHVFFPVEVEVRGVGCHTEASPATPAHIQFTRSHAGHAAIGSAITCSTGDDDATFTDVSGDSDGDLDVGERVLWFVDNTPLPDGQDEYELCVTFASR